jgi:hypothetical protein
VVTTEGVAATKVVAVFGLEAAVTKVAAAFRLEAAAQVPTLFHPGSCCSHILRGFGMTPSQTGSLCSHPWLFRKDGRWIILRIPKSSTSWN